MDGAPVAVQRRGNHGDELLRVESGLLTKKRSQTTDSAAQRKQAVRSSKRSKRQAEKLNSNQEPIIALAAGDSEVQTTASDTLSLHSLPEGVVCHIGTFLNVRSINAVRMTGNTRLNGLLRRDAAGWPERCEKLWKSKVHKCILGREEVLSRAADPKQVESMQHSFSFWCYYQSCVDAKRRSDQILRTELFYDPTSQKGTIWQFQLKVPPSPRSEESQRAANPEAATLGSVQATAAAVSTRLQNPLHSLVGTEGSTARRLVFLDSGLVLELLEDEENSQTAVAAKNSLDHASKSHVLRRPFRSAGNPEGLKTTWRFVKDPIDFPLRMEGGYIRLSVIGKDLPTFVVQRRSNEDWGFELENCWTVMNASSISGGGTIMELPLERRRNDSHCRVTAADQVGEVTLFMRPVTMLPEGNGAGRYEYRSGRRVWVGSGEVLWDWLESLQ